MPVTGTYSTAIAVIAAGFVGLGLLFRRAMKRPLSCRPMSSSPLDDCRPALQPQFSNEGWTFLLDGRVVEWFYEGLTEGTRLHVDHLRIDAVPDGDRLQIRWGVEVNGKISNGGRMTVPADNVTAFKEFVALAIANRTPGHS